MGLPDVVHCGAVRFRVIAAYENAYRGHQHQGRERLQKIHHMRFRRSEQNQ